MDVNCFLPSLLQLPFLVLADFQSCLICIARRLPRPPAITGVESFMTKQDTTGIYSRIQNLHPKFCVLLLSAIQLLVTCLKQKTF